MTSDLAKKGTGEPFCPPLDQAGKVGAKWVHDRRRRSAQQAEASFHSLLLGHMLGGAMRIIFFILGILALCAAVGGIIMSVAAPEYLWLGRIGGSAFATSGIILLVAAVKRYRGHWSFVIGLVLISSVFFGFGSELDDQRAEKSSKVEDAIVLLVGLVTLGTLSLWSANKLHQCSVALEGRNENAS